MRAGKLYRMVHPIILYKFLNRVPYQFEQLLAMSLINSLIIFSVDQQNRAHYAWH